MLQRNGDFYGIFKFTGLQCGIYGCSYRLVRRTDLKTIIYALINKTFDAERLVGSGGMPSSHSATVCALATAAGIQYGGGSFQFAVSAILAIIVMYDARGVRRETGIQAQVINEMISFFSNMGKPLSYEEKLKEFVGHTPLQVLAGALLGILIAVIYCFALG